MTTGPLVCFVGFTLYTHALFLVLFLDVLFSCKYLVLCSFPNLTYQNHVVISFGFHRLLALWLSMRDDGGVMS